MDSPAHPQLYLITPPSFELGAFPDLLAQVLDAHPVACVRLAMASKDEDNQARAADALREKTHARDVALVITQHYKLAQRLGLDGVHLDDGARSVRAARKELGEDAIVGAYCGQSRHDGMAAGEHGADYVSFGPVQPSNLGDGSFAEADLFQWWSEVIEVPVIAEGALDTAHATALADTADFIALGEEIWGTADPVQTLGAYLDALR
ncbi:MAG: thiamine phosphate synthase [Roseobacter sp.]